MVNLIKLNYKIKEKNMTIQPILNYGHFGTHILLNPAGKYSFFGTIPTSCTGTFKTFGDALLKFFEFFKSQPIDWQRENVGNMRNDVFEQFIEYNNK